MTNKNKNIQRSVQVGQSFSAEASIGLPYINIGGASMSSYKYLPYSSQNGKAPNLYPQYVAHLATESPTNGAAIQRKSFMIQGNGFDLSLLPKGLVNIFEEINHYDDTANDLLELVAQDYATFSGFALKVVWGNDGLIKEVIHVPFTQVRCGMPDEDGEVNYYVISNNWDRTLTAKYIKTYALNKFNPDMFGKGTIAKVEGIPTPSEDQLNNAEQLIYFYNKKPSASNGMEYYPVPDYIGGFDSIEAEIQIGISNKCLIDNGFGGKYIVTFPFEPQTQKEMDDNNTKLRQNFSGAGNSGGIITMYATDKEALPKVDKLEALDANTYVELNRDVKQSIVTAHQIPALLLEYNYGGGFNNRAEELTVAYNTYQKTNIASYQSKVIRVFKRIASHMGYDKIDLRIIPFTLDSTPTETQGSTNINTN